MADPAYPMEDHQSASQMPDDTPAAAGDWQIEDVRIRQTANGAFLVTCNKVKKPATPSPASGPSSLGSDYQQKDYAFLSLDEAMAYVQSEFGGAAPAKGNPDAYEDLA